MKHFFTTCKAACLAAVAALTAVVERETVRVIQTDENRHKAKLLFYGSDNYSILTSTVQMIW